MNIPEKMFQTHSWLEINVYMFAIRNTEKGELRISLQRIADEFGITKGKARYIIDNLYKEEYLSRTSTHGQRTVNARSTHNNSIENEQLKACQRTVNARTAHGQRTIEERKLAFGKALVPYLDKGYSPEMIRAFFNHWTQVNEGGRKMHFEKQQTFQIANRLAAWKRNNYGNGQQSSTDIGMVLQPEKDKFKNEKEW